MATRLDHWCAALDEAVALAEEERQFGYRTDRWLDKTIQSLHEIKIHLTHGQHEMKRPLPTQWTDEEDN